MNQILAVTAMLAGLWLAPAEAADPRHAAPSREGVSLALEGRPVADGTEELGVARARRELVQALGGGEQARSAASSLERLPLEGDLAHYRMLVQVGQGENDVIRLHRIVRERAPWVPARSRRAVLLSHGDGWAFEATFLTSMGAPSIPNRQSLAVFLAENGVDVWGVDRRWALVPATTTDLSFMADWNFGTSLDDVDLAATVARALRWVTGAGGSKLTLIGFSRGGQLGWSLLGRESQRPRFLRNIGSFVSVENAFKTDDEVVRQADCDAYDAIQAQIDAGELVTDFSVVAEIGALALDAPDDPSPFFGALSNADLAEYIGADPGGGAIAHFHSVGGVVDPMTLETELSYTASEHWFAFLAGISPFQPLGVNLEGAAISCDELDSPYDDHLAEIEAPILYIGVAGAFGALGTHATTLVASSDVASLIVSQAADPALDWGHNEPFLAEDASTEVWQPILHWVGSH